MPRGEAGVSSLVHYKGKDDDFIVFIDDKARLDEWRNDKTIAMAEFAQIKKNEAVKVTHKHGTQGPYDTASNQQLDDEFGTHNEDDVVAKILQEGDAQDRDTKGRMGDKNSSQGGSVPHG